MSKIAFVLRRRADLTPEAALAAWRSPEHTALVQEIPGLVRYVQNSVVSSPGAPVCDGIGELWFRDDGALNGARSFTSRRVDPLLDAANVGLEEERG